MSALPSISILVMSYNQEAFIGDCVDSVLSQEYEGELEFIFCDDCSVDSTFDIVQERVCHYTGKRRIVTLKSEYNTGVAGSMNTALTHARFEWIMRMDGDDIMHPDRVRLSANAITKHPYATAICGRYKYFSQNITPVINPPDESLLYYENSYLDFTETSKPKYLEWWGGIMCIKKSVFDFFGPMPHECDVLDDTMFATRSLMLGTFVTMPNATMIYYRRHSSNVSSEKDASTSLFKLIEAERQKCRYYCRGIPCHKPILDEIELYVQKHPEYQQLLSYFQSSFRELKRQGEFWNKSWRERIEDAHIQGPFWRKIPWAFRVLCPFTYALVTKLTNKS